MKKTDWLILGGVLLLGVAAFVLSRLLTPAAAEATVTVYVQGAVYARVNADDYQTITIDQGDGKVNVLVIDESGVYMQSASCRDQICVHHAKIDPALADLLPLDRWIICLPNGVSVEVTGEGAGE